MESKLLVANFKMNKTREDLRDYLAAFPKPDRDYPHTIVFCPPFTGLDYLGQKLKAPCHLGAQNIHEAARGAYTGEVSAPMLVELGVEYVLIGHRERRQYQHESDQLINQKIKTALANHLQVILCVGASQKELRNQINTDLTDIAPDAPVYLAYEPQWAINSGKPATTHKIRQITRFIKKVCPYPVLYGGSVTPKNAAKILNLPEVDGILVGTASLDPQTFAKICQVGVQ